MTRFIRAFALIVLAAAGARAAEPLTNADIVKMIKAGLSAETVELSIDTSETKFDVGADALVALKNDGVPDTVIRAMITSQAEPPTPPTPPAPPAPPAPATPPAPVVAPQPPQAPKPPARSRKRFEVAVHRSTHARCTGELEISASGIRATECHDLNFNVAWKDIESVCYDDGFRGTIFIKTAKNTHHLSTTTPAVMNDIRKLIRDYAPALECGRLPSAP